MTTMSSDLHVVFGTGPLGMAVMQELLVRGKRVRMVNRSGRAAVPQGVEMVKADATDSVSTRQACEGASVIYNCTKAPYTEWPEKFPPINEGIIDGAAYSGAKLVYADNLYMYGPTAKHITEELPNAATTRKGRTKAQMSERLLEAHRSGTVRVAIGRAPDFFGPGVLESSLGQFVFPAALAGKPAAVLGSLDQPHTYIYIRDFAKGLVTLGEQEAADGEIWHIPSAETVTTRKIIEMIFAEAGTAAKFRVAPRFFVNLSALFNAGMRESKEMLYVFEDPFVVDHSKYKNKFGNQTTPHDVAIRETMGWYRQQTK